MKTTFHVEGLACQGCANAVETILGKEDNMTSIHVDLAKKEVTIESISEVSMEACNDALAIRGFVVSKL